MQKSRPHKLIIAYTQYMMLPLLVRIPEEVLIIGIGGGSFLRFLNYHFPGIRIDAVDSCWTTLDLASKYFSLPKSDSVKIFNDSGELFLKRNKKKYDLIMIDAYDQQGMAPTIYNEESLALCRQQLSENGLLCCNIWSGDSGNLEKIRSSLKYNYNQTLYTPVPNKGNIIAVAANRPIQWNNLHPRDKLLLEMSDRLDLNFAEMVKNTRKANMSIWQTLYQSIKFQKAQ